MEKNPNSAIHDKIFNGAKNNYYNDNFEPV